MIEVNSPNAELLLFISIYRRPKGLLFDDFSAAYSKFSHMYENIIMAGDVNCSLQSENFESNYFKDFIFSLSLHLVKTGPSYHTATCDSWLEIIVTDSENKIVSFKRSAGPFIAGHDLLQLEYAFDSKLPVSHKVTRRCYGGFDSAAFLDTVCTELRDEDNFHRTGNESNYDFDNIVDVFPQTFRQALSCAFQNLRCD